MKTELKNNDNNRSKLNRLIKESSKISLGSI